MIAKARHLGKTLFVIFLDLTNAFPSVDQPTLWLKLLQWGASGPLIDWLRMLYSHLSYIVRHNNEHSDVFRAAAGILTGDPASPILWLLFISDFRLHPHPDDVDLAGTRVSNLELADDMTLASLSPAGAQDKLNQFSQYTAGTFVLTMYRRRWRSCSGPCQTLSLSSSSSTDVSPGWIQPDTQESTSRPHTLTCSPSTARSGPRHASTTHADMFTQHCKERAARAAANAALAVESHVGVVPATTARTLYLAHVEPHFVFGCEVALDARQNALKALEDLQLTYLRRLLRLSTHSQIVPLFTETGIWPVRYRRMEYALRYAKYLATGGPVLPRLALQEAVALAKSGASSWWSDLQHALAALPVPVNMDWWDGPTAANLDKATKDVTSSLALHLWEGAMASTRLPLLQSRLHAGPRLDHDLANVAMWRPYLAVERAPHRAALTRLVASEHPLAVEVLRRAPLRVPRERRVCRFCKRRACIEDEAHILFECGDARPKTLREWFFAEMLGQCHVNLPYLLEHSPMSPGAILHILLHREDAVRTVAEYVHTVFDLVQQTPLLIVHSDEDWAQLTIPEN